jgi:hypothetical protein
MIKMAHQFCCTTHMMHQYDCLSFIFSTLIGHASHRTFSSQFSCVLCVFGKLVRYSVLQVICCLVHGLCKWSSQNTQSVCCHKVFWTYTLKLAGYSCEFAVPGRPYPSPAEAEGPISWPCRSNSRRVRGSDPRVPDR